MSDQHTKFVVRCFALEVTKVEKLPSSMSDRSVKGKCSTRKDLYIICPAMGLKNGTNTKIILRLLDDIQIVAKIVVFRKISKDVTAFETKLTTLLKGCNNTQ
uniref:Uncharacterized protein n=1 Tax=Glossina pallidipes TaxID=7398 RepID=A0A1B0ACP9_GLOPL